MNAISLRSASHFGRSIYGILYIHIGTTLLPGDMDGESPGLFFWEVMSRESGGLPGVHVGKQQAPVSGAGRFCCWSARTQTVLGSYPRASDVSWYRDILFLVPARAGVSYWYLVVWCLSGDGLGPRTFSLAQAESVAWRMSGEILVLRDDGKRCSGEGLGDGGGAPFVFPASPRLIWSHRLAQQWLLYGEMVEKGWLGIEGEKVWRATCFF